MAQELQKKPKGRSRKALSEEEEEESYPIRLHVSGSTIDIASPVPREQFIKEMVEAINENGARAEWSGWYTLQTVDGKIASVRVREIGIAEEI
tara:strand:- start:52 stop:330 length:279 start_codon:yes stop_codon:yes gene_type:complete